jgi:hypothetical protein
VTELLVLVLRYIKRVPGAQLEQLVLLTHDKQEDVQTWHEFTPLLIIEYVPDGQLDKHVPFHIYPEQVC